MSRPRPVDRLIRALARLPGIGPKTSERLAYFVLRAEPELAQELVEAFTSGKVDEMRMFTTRFQSMVKFVPTDAAFLPIKTIAVGEDAEQQKMELDFLIEPDATTVFNALMPRYLETVVFDAMLQSLTSEHASRRMAMKGATDAAGRMQKDLKKIYNRARQESITKELLDIVGGASAVS